MLLFWRFIASQWLLVLSWLFLLFFVLFLHFLAFLLFYVLSYFLSFCGVLFPCFNWCVLSMAFVAIACSSCFLPLFWFFLLYWLLCLASPSGTIRRCSCFALCVRPAESSWVLQAPKILDIQKEAFGLTPSVLENRGEPNLPPGSC